jgi:SAM-dependent methyltransferase
LQEFVHNTKVDRLTLPARDFRFLLDRLGPSLGFWRAAEIAVFRNSAPYEPPILDLGCGDGLVTSRVFPRVALGVDPDPIALQNAQRLGIYTDLLCSRMEDADLPAEQFGTVISNSVLEHIPDVDSTLAAVAQVLKVGGQFIFTTPTDAFSKWLALPLPSYARLRNRQYQHLNLWTVEEWNRRLTKVGFCIDAVQPYLGRGWVWAWDMLELLQRIQVGKKPTRLFGWCWKRIPPVWIDRLARRAAHINLSAPFPGGGRLIVCRKI